jgi:asparagine synthase (glutamine-hydrolysing)
LRRELEGKGHRFRSSSDTEVILEAYRAWGLDCVDRLNGMFAFSLYDSSLRRVFFARDRAGEKPLFYRHENGRLVFASELKAIMADPSFGRELDPEAFNEYLAYGYVPREMCILKGVKKLPQGHAMTYDLDKDELRVWGYWRLPEPCFTPEGAAGESEAELAEALEELLTDSVRLRLIADVPVGILLSGGMDSSLVTALAARVSSKPVRTYTISFPGHGRYDEGPHARLVAEHFGTEHTELVAEPATVALLPELARQYDEPMADSSMTPTYLISKLIRSHATVALGGDGGDELFGGYLHYNWLLREELLRRYVPAPLRALSGATAARLMPVGARGRNHLIGFAGEAPQSIAHVNLYFDAGARSKLLAPELRRAANLNGAPESEKSRLCAERATVIQRATAVDFMSYLVDDILVKVDRASMLASLEVRAPWLDHRIIEFAFGRTPDALRATRKELKILPRRLARRLLPPTFNLTRKQGFSLPLNAWFKGDWGSYIKSVLREADTRLFNRQSLQRLIATQERGGANMQRLFALTMFELWRRHYRIRIPN